MYFLVFIRREASVGATIAFMTATLRLFSGLFVVAALAGCPSPPPTGCTSNAECPAGRTCVDRACVVSPDAARPDAPLPVDAACACTAGQTCALGMCRNECGNPAALPCASGTTCDFITSACVPTGTSGTLTGEGVMCGSTRCLPGTECNAADSCEPAAPCVSMTCANGACWGTSCTATRRVAACTPAPLPRLNQADFTGGGDGGLVDLEFDDACSAYGVTTISGRDYMRELHADGTLIQYNGVTNLNMGEVAVLRAFTGEFGTEPGDAALTYICCATCGCVGADPQGVARLVREPMPTLPMVINAVPTTGTGPFGSVGFDTGPYGLTWGRDRTLYVGNVMRNGDFHSASLDTGTTAEVHRFDARVHASTTFSASELLIALADRTLVRMSNDGMHTRPFATVPGDVTSLVRDPFNGAVYVSLRDGTVIAFDARGNASTPILTTPGRNGRIAYGPDGRLYYLRFRFPGRAMIETFDLPMSL